MMLATAALVMAAMMVAIAMPAFAVGHTNPDSCGLGDAASSDAHSVGGLGHFDDVFGDDGFSMGEQLQDYRAFSQPGCQGK